MVVQTRLKGIDKGTAAKKQYLELSVNAKNNSYKDDAGCGILKKGTVVTVKEVQVVDSATWLKIPSGWICGISVNSTIYVQ